MDHKEGCWTYLFNRCHPTYDILVSSLAENISRASFRDDAVGVALCNVQIMNQATCRHRPTIFLDVNHGVKQSNRLRDVEFHLPSYGANNLYSNILGLEFVYTCPAFCDPTNNCNLALFLARQYRKSYLCTYLCT